MAKRNNRSDNSLAVRKTYKIYIGGTFPRTESGRFYQPLVDGKPIANVCRCSRKDLRNAIVAARAAQPGWASRTAYNRSQILYRMAEMLEGRREQFVTELKHQGLSSAVASRETAASIDRLVHYAGWCDKYQQVFATVNPVASSHFNFSVLEPTGVVGLFVSESSPLLGLISLFAPVIASGNSCVAVASESLPLSAVTFAELLATSDLPGGVVNILTGSPAELAEPMARHMDVNAIGWNRESGELLTSVKQWAAGNVKRVKAFDTDWTKTDSQSPWLIHDFCEVKTTWHPIEEITAAGVTY